MSVSSRKFALGLSILAGLLLVSSSVETQGYDDELGKTRSALLKTYSDYKGYSLSPEDVFNALESDRRAVFDATVRALFQDLEHPLGTSTGERLITHVKEVRGIWGARDGETKGEFVFRLSLKFDGDIKKVLDGKDNFTDSSHAHVLLPVPQGGDDEPKHRGTSATGDKLTYRQKGTPSIQISFLANDVTTGEVDIDFDEKWRVEGLRHCHTKPSNSDVGSVGDHHSHLDRFRNRYDAFFNNGIQINWTSSKHCENAY